MNNEILEFLIEDIQFVDIMSNDIFEEGLFDNFKKTPDKSKTINIDNSKLINDTVSLFKYELKQLKTKYPIKNSIYMVNNDEYHKEDKKSFINKETKSLSIAQYDMYKFSNSPRDTDENKKFWKYTNELITNINKEISKYGAKIEADGDWDTGSFYLEIK